MGRLESWQGRDVNILLVIYEAQEAPTEELIIIIIMSETVFFNINS